MRRFGLVLLGLPREDGMDLSVFWTDLALGGVGGHCDGGTGTESWEIGIRRKRDSYLACIEPHKLVTYAFAVI